MGRTDESTPMEGIDFPRRSNKSSSLRRMQSEYQPSSARQGSQRPVHSLASSRMRDPSRGGFWDTVLDKNGGGGSQLAPSQTFHFSGNASSAQLQPAQSFHAGSSASRMSSKISSSTKHFRCVHCNSTYSSQKDLQSHVQKKHPETAERPYTCEVCSNKFSQKSHLNQHKRTVHDKQRPHACDLCEKAFGKKYDLASHKDAVHTQAKRHQCEFCEKRFAKRSNLTRHTEKLHEKLSSRK